MVFLCICTAESLCHLPLGASPPIFSGGRGGLPLMPRGVYIGLSEGSERQLIAAGLESPIGHLEDE
jgi:hypothetical protein